jgi:hypothetical protein
MYFRLLDSILARARVPPKRSLNLPVPGRKQQPGPEALAYVGTVLLALTTRLRSIPRCQHGSSATLPE